MTRGRQEFGPRALGHRSLFAVTESEGMRKRMNRLKFRPWYQPVAPLVAVEALPSIFGHPIESPYMSLAPRVRPEMLAQFPALAHLDGTARHQSVGKEDEPWIHALLHSGTIKSPPPTLPRYIIIVFICLLNIYIQ